MSSYVYANANSLRFVDEEGKDIAVIIGDRYDYSFNIAGHAAMAVSNKGVYSWGTSHKFGISIFDYLWDGKEPQVPHRNVGVYIIESSPIEDDKAIKEFLKIRNKGYSLLGGRTCATAVAAALKYGLGINDIDLTRFPAVLQREVYNYSSYYLYFEQNSKPSYIDKIMLSRF